ncbi:MAG TPA: hypothetical protein ENG51_07610 [Deltaproteobacteria bacterium]|nr:hypothetical protein [Deltaproteobacteria bacterium]
MDLYIKTFYKPEPNELPELYELLRRFEDSKDKLIEIMIMGESAGVLVDNSLAQMACYIAREHLKREIARLEGKMRQEMERGIDENVSV